MPRCFSGTFICVLLSFSHRHSLFRPIISQNQKRDKSKDYQDIEDLAMSQQMSDPLSFICDMREYDVPYTMRVSIDMELRVGAWYIVRPNTLTATCSVEWQRDMIELCEPRILAFDIECEKSPLKFPNAERDRIFMISYMTAGQGFLLINRFVCKFSFRDARFSFLRREVVSEDISDFEYTPLPKYPGPFTVFNLANEELLLKKFLTHIQVSSSCLVADC